MIDRQLDIKQAESIFVKFKCLNIVEFSKNQLSSIPDSLLNNERLLSLTIENNPVKTLKDVFNQATNLKHLELNNLAVKQENLFPNGINTKMKLFSLPKGLETLVLKAMQFAIMPFDLSSCSKSLRKLHFEAVAWPQLDEYGGVNAIITHEQIRKLYVNQFTEDEFTKLFKAFDSMGGSVKGVLQRHEILKLNAFVFKRFPRLASSALFPFHIDCLSGFPSSIFKLKNLTHLNLSYQVTEIYIYLMNSIDH